MKIAQALTIGLAATLVSGTAVAGPYDTRGDRYPSVGVILSEREKRESVPVRLPDGRVVLRPVHAEGLPFLFGFGESYGNPSGMPLKGGATPSQMKSTPSGGLIPGQEPE